MKAVFKCDIEDKWPEFYDYTVEELTYAIRRAVNTAAYMLKTLTQSNFNSTGIRNDRNPKYIDTLSDAIRMRKSRVTNMGEDIFSEVSILGSRETGSGTFRLRFFEKGTNDRYQNSINGHPLKKPRYVGRIKPSWFFKNANVAIESQIDSIYNDQITKAIEKINSTNI